MRWPCRQSPSAPPERTALVATLVIASVLLCLRIDPLSRVLRQRRPQPGVEAVRRTSDLKAARALLASWPQDKPKACIFILARNR